MEKTTNLKLNKPTMADFVSESVEKVFGDNLDILDAVISALQTAQNSHADNKSNPHSVKFDQTIEQLAAGADLNDISDGMFFFRNNTVNAPVTGTGLVLQASPGSGAMFQMAVHDMTSTTCIYQRYKVTTGWSEWKNSYMSPAFTGTPTAPTAESGTSTTQIATTAFVAAAIAAIQITKEAVGLGNVPNVTTNDQTPTYTAASDLATLVSGEKLSVSMGKIMLAITNLISHLANTSNPHSVTLAQLGAAAASHKHSAGDITSGTLPASRGGTGKTSLSALATAIFASPAFTGVPTAPTAESGTNTTQVATTAFVNQATQNNIIFGTYTGDGNASQSISLGAQPVAVEVYRADGVQTLVEMGYGRPIHYGGLAIRGNSCKCVSITSTGFNVYYDNSGTSSDEKIYGNTTNTKYYYKAYMNGTINE